MSGETVRSEGWTKSSAAGGGRGAGRAGAQGSRPGTSVYSGMEAVRRFE